MGGQKYAIDQVVGNIKVLGIARSYKTPAGGRKRYYNIECLLCGTKKEMGTQTIDNAKTCGCGIGLVKIKHPNSGKKSAPGTRFEINVLISIYKSNARKRKVDFELQYSEFEKLITSNCSYCGDPGDNVLRKKNYPEFSYCGIDRIDNCIGYQSGNCVSCCQWCNEAKNSNDLNTFIDKCKKVSSYFEIAQKRIAASRIEGVG